jgi:hypothetical protein
VGAQLSGPITTLQLTPDGNNSEFVRFDTDGKLQWTQTDTHDFEHLYVEPNAGRLFAMGPDHAGPDAPSNAWALNPDGTGEHEIAEAGGLGCSAWVAAADAQGDRTLGDYCPTSGTSDRTTMEIRPSDGASWSINSEDGVLVQGATFDPDRNVVLIGKASRATTLQGHAVVAGMLIAKLSRDGNVQWVQQLPGDGTFWAVGTSAKGTVVVLGVLNQASTWGAQSIGGVTLLTAEADGTPRWARAIQGIGDDAMQLVVDPAGQAAIAIYTACHGFTVFKYNLAGDFLWQRSFAPKECDDNHAAGFAGLAIVGNDVVVAGDYSGTVDFGTGEQSSGGGFLLKLSQ